MNDGNEEKGINNSLVELTIEKVFDMRKEVLDRQKNLEKSHLEVVEKLRLCDEKIENLSKVLLSKLDKIFESLKLNVSSKMEDNAVSAFITSPADSTQHKESKEMFSASGKYFVLKHTFNNVSSIENGNFFFSEEEEHFGVPWRIKVKRCNGFLSLYLVNLLPKSTEKKWEIEVEFELKIVSPSSRAKKEKRKSEICNAFKNVDSSNTWGHLKFIEWEKLEKDFTFDDCFCAEISVNVKKMTGVYKENLRSFDKTMEECSDVVLIVKQEKFFVSKLYLVTHSSYFKVLFLGNFNEAKQTDIKLAGIDADDFQNYLEVLYGEQAINEFTVEGILMVADMYDTGLVIQKCETFLLKESKKKLKKKLQLSTRHNLAALTKQCIEEIK